MVFESRGNVCVSARPGEVAVSGRPFGQVVTDLAHWEFYRVPGIEAAQEQPILEFLFAQSVTEYSYSGIIWSQVFGVDHQAAGQWFCSELAYQVLWNYGNLSTFDAPANWSPAELRALIISKSCVKIDLQSV